MTLRRILPRALASLGAVVLVASVPAWTFANASGAPGGEPSDQAVGPWLGSEVESSEPTADVESGETSEAETDGSSGSSLASGGGTFDGTSGWIDFGGYQFWIGPPGSRSEVVATVAAYRAGLGLPAFVPIENLGGWSCTMVAHGSATASTEPTNETLGQLLIRRSPAAVGFQPAAGWAVSATIIVDELIVNDVVYPNRATQIGVMHCSPPPPPPSSPTPSPSEPAPIEPSPPPAETSPPPAEPEPTETPTG
jgi:hypothetical protein